MPFVESESASVWYHDEGQGAAVLMIQGGLMDPMDGERFWITPGVAPDLVAVGFRVLVPDRRYGGGRTSAPFVEYSWDSDARDTVAVLRDAGVERAHIITGSNGCSVAIRLALAHPEVLRSLILCWLSAPDEIPGFERSAAFIEQHGPAAYLEYLREHGVPLPMREPDEPGFPFGTALSKDERTAESLIDLSPQAAAAIVRATGSNLQAGEVMRGVSQDDVRILDNGDYPVLVVPVAGEDPGNHPLELAEKFVHDIRRATLASGVAVTPIPAFVEYRETFAKMVIEFIEQGNGGGVA